MENKNTPGIAYSGGGGDAYVGGATNKNGKRSLIIAAIVIIAALIIGGIVWLSASTNNQSPVNRQYNDTSLDLTDVASSDFKDTEQLSILGQLNVQGGFAIAPTSKPTSAQPGQIYYDQNSNLLSYYNGSEFIDLSG